jgi:hypothetical protein
MDDQMVDNSIPSASSFENSFVTLDSGKIIGSNNSDPSGDNPVQQLSSSVDTAYFSSENSAPTTARPTVEGLQFLSEESYVPHSVLANETKEMLYPSFDEIDSPSCVSSLSYPSMCSSPFLLNMYSQVS